MLFSKLTEEQQKDFFDHNQTKFDVPDDWDECLIDDITAALECIGFGGVKVGFRGFWSQGDGANFTGCYSYKKGALKAVTKEHPWLTTIHELAKELQALESKNFYKIGFKITHSGRYAHENSNTFEFWDDRSNYGYVSHSFDDSPWIAACRGCMQDIYNLLEKEYDYLTSWEHVKENPDMFDHIDIGDCE